MKREKRSGRHTSRSPPRGEAPGSARPATSSSPSALLLGQRGRKGPRWPGSTMRLTMTPFSRLIKDWRWTLPGSLRPGLKHELARSAPGGGAWAAQCPVLSTAGTGPPVLGRASHEDFSRSIRERFLSAHHARGGRRLCVIHFPRSTQHGEPDTEPHSERAPPSGLRRDCRGRRKGRESTEDQTPPCSWPRGDATQPAEN